MNILVCIKPVPDPQQYGQLKIDNKTKRLIREGIKTVINPTDKNALEEAIRLRDEAGGKITLLTMAPEFSRDRVTEGLAMGGDEGYMLSDRDFGGADTYATSFTLSEAIRKIQDEKHAEFDLILAGNESADGGTSHVPAQLAAWLELPHMCNVNKIEIKEQVISVWKKTESGRNVFEGRLPALISVSRDINKPRLVNAMGIIKARKKPLTVWDNSDLNLNKADIGLEGSPTKPGELISPQLSRAGKKLGDSVDEAVETIINLIGKAGV